MWASLCFYVLEKTCKHLKKREEYLRKILISLLLTLFVSGCAETIALLGPASTSLGSGRVAQSAVSTVVNFGVKQQTGKSPMEHAFAYAEKHNPERKKIKCVNFLEITETEVCSILKKRVSELRRKIDVNSKIKILD